MPTIVNDCDDSRPMARGWQATERRRNGGSFRDRRDGGWMPRRREHAPRAGEGVTPREELATTDR